MSVLVGNPEDRFSRVAAQLNILFSEAADSENIPQWEKDLQKELQDYEMVNDNNDLDDLDIENEILQQIENETDNP